jgi:cytochrome c oxidase assembly protein subunit 15
MVGGVFFEHGHRMAAGLVGFLTVVLAVWTQAREDRRELRILGWVALSGVVAQGLLGGLTVVLLLPTVVSVAHACLAQLFFCSVIAYAYVASREWVEAGAVEAPGVKGAAYFVTGAAFLQLLIGAFMRHLDERSWAAPTTLPIPDFPLSLGRVVPPLDTVPIAAHFAHRVWALVVLGGVVYLVDRGRRSGDRRLVGPALLALGAVLAQIGLGAATVLTARSVLPTTAHVMVGALILGTSFFLSLRASRLVPTEAQERLPEADPVGT